MTKKYHIGCSGFYYNDWAGDFYPEGLNKREWLEYYAQKFDTVEINNSFYRMPNEKTVEGWYKRTPKNFTFTLKGNRYITHIKRLKGVSDNIPTFYHLADLLKEKLACILWQLPPNFKVDHERLEDFCSTLSTHYRNVIEFRHQSWFEEEVYDILRKHQVAYCIISAPGGLPEDIITTTNFSYIRFHGKTQWYKYDYSQKQLQEWRDKMEALETPDNYIYFNNDYDTRAIKNAYMLQHLLEYETTT